MQDEAAPRLFANARMYSVTPAVAQAWRGLLTWVLARAALPWSVLDYPAPRPLNALWQRDDLGCALMCGLARAVSFPRAALIVAPVVDEPRYGGVPVYFTDIVVRADSSYASLDDTFGARVGYTVRDSHSGYVALREHLLPHRLARGAPLYGDVIGPLVSPRAVVEALLVGRIDVGPLDSYAHDLMRANEPQLATRLRAVATTRPAPIPPFVATAPLAPDAVRNLQAAFAQANAAAELQPLRATLRLAKLVVPELADYETFHARSAASERYPDAW
ncbi:MAG: PhnD/SsuA/transferrin family substrate-binding protein [Xanthobacteraceae bacterium]|nr:PhnD/SsuA/transferrin family substrate-binding protein [Xanthobacteraceae bacterium]